MVKGISRQVILVHAPDPKLFEQAIFILREDALGSGITKEQLLQEADRLMHSGSQKARSLLPYGLLWALCGSAVTGLCWLLTLLIPL